MDSGVAAAIADEAEGSDAVGDPDSELAVSLDSGAAALDSADGAGAG